MTDDADDAARFECPECSHHYDAHVCVDGRQGCCPACHEPVRDRAQAPDPGQGDLGRWT